MEKFTREQDLLLLELVRSNKVLYDVSEKEYKNNVYKHCVWAKISEAMNVSVPDVKKRWKHLRDHYNKKMKIENGSKCNWEYMPYMKFIANKPFYRTTFTNVEAVYNPEKQEPEESEVNEEQYQNQMIDNSDQNKDNEYLFVQNMSTDNNEIERKRKSTTALIDILEKRILNKISKQENMNPIKKFFDSMSDIVSQFPPHLAAEARLKVCQVVTDIELKMHNDMSNINSNMTPPSDEFIICKKEI